MPPELLSTVLSLRLDAICVGALALAGCDYCRGYARRKGAAQDFPAAACVSVIVLAVAGAALAEGMAALIGYPEYASPAMLAAARGALLGAVASAAGLLLFTSIRIALLRSELRAHGDMARQLQQAKIAADAANRAKSDFLAVMSHEIRTPLNAVMGFANLLAETRLEEAQRGYVGTITAEGARLTALINDILDLTKIEEGRLTLERLPFAPAETANEVLRLLSSRALEKKLDLRFEAQLAGPLLVAGDPLRFRQVLVNLVDNAIKFTPQGSVTLFMNWIAAEKPGTPGQLRVRVCDTGIGIAPEKLQDLFQMFMQADTSTTRRYGGTGLGLAICQRLVVLMGSDIAVKSTPGHGSEFSFTLPFTAVAGAEAPAPEPEPLTIKGRRPRILVVDDMETNRFLLEVFLARNGFDPELASGGEEAIRLASAKTYDAILMDLQMPDLDGYEAARRIRTMESGGRRTPIIALTASITKGTREKCLAAGMDEHMTKPLDLKRFKALLHTFVSTTAAAAAVAAQLSVLPAN